MLFGFSTRNGCIFSYASGVWSQIDCPWELEASCGRHFMAYKVGLVITGTQNIVVQNVVSKPFCIIGCW